MSRAMYEGDISSIEAAGVQRMLSNEPDRGGQQLV
jgi:hypothetical protein